MTVSFLIRHKVNKQELGILMSRKRYKVKIDIMLLYLLFSLCDSIQIDGNSVCSQIIRNLGFEQSLRNLHLHFIPEDSLSLSLRWPSG